MSQMSPTDLQCPQCGNTQKTMVWSSLNVTLDPDLKDRLYAGEVNVFECEDCGEKVWINAPLLYHDMTNEFCVQYYDVEILDDSDILQRFNSDGSIAIAGIPEAFAESSKYMTRPHIVFDINEMLRYVEFRERIASPKDESPSLAGDEEVPF